MGTQAFKKSRRKGQVSTRSPKTSLGFSPTLLEYFFNVYFRTLVDTIYSMKDELKELREEQKTLRGELETERRARKRLETLLRKSLKHSSLPNMIDVNSNEESPPT